jgi:hypothetical protein
MRLIQAHARARTLWRTVLLACALCLVTTGTYARTEKKAATPEADPSPTAATLGIKVVDDRMTLALTKSTQVYLFGMIDAGAPQRFDELVKSWKIPAGSDIYLDSAGGDLAAGVALGRLFRAGRMVIHLGTPKRTPGSPAKASTCMDACAYAYFGGLYRWAPTGTDRLGLHALPGDASPQAPPKADAPAVDVAGYLKDMGIRPTFFVPAKMPATDGVAWLSTDQLFEYGLANNGRLPLSASSQVTDGVPLLTFNQTVRTGENRVTLQCRPAAITMATVYVVGADRAKELVGREARSYFEINHQEIQPQQTERARVDGQAVVFSRSLSLDQVASLLGAESLGVWVKDKNGFVRYGFTIGPVTVKASVADFYAQCQRVVQRPMVRKTP